MPRHEEQKTLAYTADELFSVVANVKDYPSFVPWCTGAHIRPAGDRTHVDLVVDFQFKSHLLDHVANTMFHEASTRMMGAFESRVHLVHLMTQRQKQHPSS